MCVTGPLSVVRYRITVFRLINVDKMSIIEESNAIKTPQDPWQHNLNCLNGIKLISKKFYKRARIRREDYKRKRPSPNNCKRKSLYPYNFEPSTSLNSKLRSQNRIIINHIF